jgi:transposase-like protein
MQDIALFVAVGIDLDGMKQVLGFWVGQGKESKAFWVEVFQDLVNRGVQGFDFYNRRFWWVG